MNSPRYIVHAFTRSFHEGDDQIIALGDDGTLWKLVMDDRWKLLPSLPEKEYDDDEGEELDPAYIYPPGTK